MKHVVIVGASSGIGYRAAEIMASNGCKVGVAARKTDSLKNLKLKYPDFVEYMHIDITESNASDRLLELIDIIGGMDVYFHVAGIGYDNPEILPERDFEIVNTNSCGFVKMVCTAYKYFRDNRIKGHIAAVTSVAGTNGIGEMAAYSASKSMAQTYLVALEQLSNKEKSGISFTDIRPGWIRTNFLKPGHKYVMEMPIDYVVSKMLKAIERKRRIAVIDWRWNIMMKLWRIVPNCLWVRLNISCLFCK